jgi:hypothetical protein
LHSDFDSLTDSPTTGKRWRFVRCHGACSTGQNQCAEVLVGGRPQEIVANPAGWILLNRIGDAVASRNVHAAIFY